ncbi:helix-turn-helix domain-containing protein [Butyrivibrio sp. AD3002]|uniref:helix-turn-helix domain-containing protein n=1 Tax=Butyrivibrio sp. AD3002 TaxID=1280670 RepID=UPI0003B61BC9|nr:helix-turn-helix transcriptional regulator [Butyrivibrio sp. AD3002]
MNALGYTNELHRKIKKYRIETGLTQKELALKAGVSARSLSRFECGEDISLSNFVKILLALDLIDAVNNSIPDMENRPSVLLAKERNEDRERVRKKTAKKQTFKWGDEK